MIRHYLEFRLGEHVFLLDMAQVVEVALAPPDNGSGATHRAWRGHALPLLWLTEDEAPRAQWVVVRVGEEHALLPVDEITGLLPVNDNDLLPFAPAGADTARRVDRALPRPGGCCALRLRWPPPRRQPAEAAGADAPPAAGSPIEVTQTHAGS